MLGLAHRLDDHYSRVLQYCATATKGTISEGQEAHLPLPFALDAALGQENQILDSLSDRGDGPHLEDTWHWLTSGNSIERVLRQCRDVVGDDDALLVGGPFQNRRIICSERPTS